MVYLKSVENVITLGKLIGLLFLFCLLLLSILFLKTKRNDLARPVNGNHFYSPVKNRIQVGLPTSESLEIEPAERRDQEAAKSA